MTTIRLNKYIGDTGFCSRREADQLIDDERVTVNGILAQKGQTVNLESDKVRLDGEILKYINVAEEAKKLKEQLPPMARSKRPIYKSSGTAQRGTRGGVRNKKVRVATNEEADSSEAPKKFYYPKKGGTSAAPKKNFKKRG